jgi:hypothetical protein
MPRRTKAQVLKAFDSDWHDPTDAIVVETDSDTGDVFHRYSYYEEWRVEDDHACRHRTAAPFLHRLSKDPVRRSAQLRWLKKGVNPFDVKSLMKYVRKSRDPAGRWCALHDIERFGLIDKSCGPFLDRLVRRDPSQDNKMFALSQLASLQKERAEPLYLEALRSKWFHVKLTPIWCIYTYGGVGSVPAVCEFVQRAVRRQRRAEGWDTDLSYAIRFLDRFLDSRSIVEVAFKSVIKYWKNLAYEEADCILKNARYIGIRTLEPIPPTEDPEQDRTTITTPAFRRRLWKNKERFRNGFKAPA